MGDECGQDRKHRISVKPSHAWVSHRRADQLNIEHLFRSVRYETITGKGRLGKTGLRQPSVWDGELDGIVSFVSHVSLGGGSRVERPRHLIQIHPDPVQLP